MGLFSRKKKEEAPEVRAYGPDPWPLPLPYQYANTWSGVTVDECSTLGVTAAWRSVNMIGNAVAELPIHAYRQGMKVTTPSLLDRPNPVETRVETIFQIICSLLLRGNAYCLLGDFDNLQYPRSLVVLNPDEVTVKREEGQIIYKVGDVKLSRYEVLHIKGFTLPGAIQGVGVVEANRQAIGHALALGEYGQRFFGESANPTALLTNKNPLTKEEADAAKQAWMNAAGARNREPVVIGSDWEFKPLSFSPEDSQFLQSRNFSLLEVAHMFGLPPYYLGAPGSSMTYSNVEQEGLNFVRWTLQPWLVRIEQALSDLLPRGTVAKFNTDALLRADTKTRYEAHKIALESGFMTVDEVRELENREPLPEKEEPKEEVQEEGPNGEVEDE